MTLWGFLAARAAFVLKHWESYRDAPLGMLDIRDGGFIAFAGLLAACAVGFEQLRRAPILRRPLTTAALAGVLVWGGATLALHAGHAPAPLPRLVLQRLDGGAVDLRQFTGRPVVVNLWATWCPPCQREMPALTAAQAAHPEVTFLFVNAGEDAATVQRYLAAAGVAPENVLLDAPRAAARAMDAVGYPTTLFYDARGMLAARHMGELSRAAVEEQLGQLRRAP
ncbi:redoxin family protein [Massilia jejuensis]|uniref:Redoxin family protein n=1 Tax=Massilia jejuensis TaxID=648894 RepID=A0ABW0PDP6_9BURK